MWSDLVWVQWPLFGLLTCLKDLVHLLHKDGVERGEVPT